jgi:hypothetical protein
VHSTKRKENSLVKKQSLLVLVAVAVLLGLALTGPAGAAGEVGFDIDCTGAYGYGWVAAHICHTYTVGFHDPGWAEPEYWSGEVCGGESGVPFDVRIPWPVAPITGESYFWWWIDGVGAEGHFECEPPPPCGEGCTPGFWRQPQHLDSWTGYAPGDDFDAVFGTDYFDPDITLLEAVWLGGGGVKKLGRHGAAALLNAANPDVGYPLSEAEVIAAVQAGDAKMLAELNELGCPLD